VGEGVRQAVVVLCIAAAAGWCIVEVATTTRPRWARRLLPVRLLLPAMWTGLLFVYVWHAVLTGD
jgi:hypothetical protein